MYTNNLSFQTKNTCIKGGILMTQTCFYCTNETEEKEMHFITFDVTNTTKEEILCNECYQEWLHGIKG